MTTSNGPRLVLTALHDVSTRPAALTESHGAAMSKLFAAAKGHKHDGIHIVEMSVPAPVFVAARKAMQKPRETVALYDLFPFPSKLDGAVRDVAARFLATESLWSLAEEGKLGEFALDVRIPTPRGWDRDPKKIQERLVEAGALDLTEEEIATYQAVRAAFDAT